MADCFLPFCPAPVPPQPHPEFAVFYAAVTPSPSNAALNPNADVFENKAVEGASDGSIWSYSDVDYPTEDAYVYMNGDIGKLPSGAVYPATPDSLATTATTSSDFSSLNGLGDSLETYVQDSSPPGGSLADPTPGSDAGIPLDQLKQMLSSQLEYYFSRENLANDAYLLSQMDNDQYVPIWTVANFNQVKKLTKDIKLITEVLRESPNVQVDEEGQKVRPNHKRCIVILREIPDHTPLEEVKALFSGEGCPKLISCEFAHNNSWYVTFESDEDAQRAYRFLREEVREFQGKPIMARIKAKPMNRLPIPPVPSMGVALKNGYRTPPALYDPNTYQGQQRFLYSNGSTVAPNVNFGSQVHVYAFQQHQPFYPPSMVQHWASTSPAYFDIGSVFSVNGLAPTGSFVKPPAARYVPRNRSKRSQPIPERGSLSDSVVNVTRQSVNSHQYHPFGTGSVTTVSVTVPKTTSSSSVASVGKVPPTVTSVAATTVVTATVVDTHSKTQPLQQDNSDSNGPNQGTQLRTETEDAYKQRDVLTGKEPMPPRHRRRRREDEVLVTGRTPAVVGVTKPASSGGSPQPVNRETLSVNVRTAQFDLEATAFPPLPGLEAVTGSATKTVASVETTHAETSNSHWENRLSDVVKGTAKPKCQAGGTNGSGKEKESSSISPRGLSPVPTVPPAPSTSPAPACTPSPVAVAVAVNTETKSLPSPPQLHGTQHEREVKDVGTGSDTALSLVTLTPPSSPDKTVPVVKCMADKSTKTDDTLLNGDSSCGVAGVNLRPDSGTTLSTKQGTVASNSSAAVSVTKHVPTTTNAATMTSAVVVTDTVITPARQCPPAVVTTGLPPSSVAPAAANCAPVSDNSAPTLTPVSVSTVETACATTRLSYAQVAQHNKEKLMQRDKQSSEQQEKEKEKKKDAQTSRGAQHSDSRDQSAPREYREGQTRQHMGRGGPRPVYDRDRGGLRRREGVPRYREFLRPRSPK